MENFVEDFKTTKAEAIHKTYMRLWKEKSLELENIKQKATISNIVFVIFKNYIEQNV